MTEHAQPWRAVLDTNLLVSGFVSKIGAPYELMQRWYDRAFVMVLTRQLRAEYEEVLARPRLILKHGLSHEEIGGFFEALSIDGDGVEALSPLPIAVRDAKDERVLAAALDGRADYLVTGDNDLLVLAGDPRLGALKIVSARAFLDVLSADVRPANP
ncbi:MAG TPA: putative toxin-antitoxin system toxin component, PIN family [Thermomicrobiales bacterium]|jgi:putative PIN family toxin of toxin-antitoxin system